MAAFNVIEAAVRWGVTRLVTISSETAHLDGEVDVCEPPREPAGGISTTKARRLLGWTARRSWRDHLDDSGRRRD